jgi:nucleotide-binding universal stress UspA family protein
MGSEAGVAIKKTLLDGKPFQKILDHARKTNPWLIVMGRIGVHSPKDETGLGSNAENVLRAAPCDVLSPRDSRSRGSMYAPRRPCAGRRKPRSG